MRNRLWAFLSLVSLVAALLCGIAGSISADELRGVWVDGWHAGYLNQAEVNQLLGVVGNASSKGDIRNANLNAVFIEVRRHADVCYPSGLGEPYFKWALTPSNFNALQAVINAAHDTTGGKKRIEVHAWIVAFNTGANEVYEAHSSASNPDNYWPTRNNSGAENEYYSFDPGHPKAMDYTVNVAMDLVNNFDIDGIHWDYIRFVNANDGYNPTSIARYNARYNASGQPVYNNSNFQQWRRDQITSVVRKTYAKMLAVKPDIKHSASVMTSVPSPTSSTRSAFQSTPPYVTYYSDWDSWLEEGIVDMIVPMNYFNQNTYPTHYANWLNYQKDRKHGRHMINGPGIYLNTKANAISQLLASRTASASGNYMQGFCGYCYYEPYAGGTWADFSSSLVSQVTPTTANIPSMSWKTSPTKGHISGSVTIGATGAWCDGAYGATVSISGPASKSMRCDGTGFYAFMNLTPGTYTVTASVPGYADVVKSVNVQLGSVTGNMYVTNFAAGALPPPTISNVQASTPTNNSVTITWTTDQPSTTQIDYGVSTSYGSSTPLNSSLVTSHSQTITGLSPLTLYHYRVKSTNSNGTRTSGDYTFTTSGPPTISNVQATNIGANTATITWTTNAAANSAVNYGLTTAYGGVASNTPYVTSHSVALSGLAANKEYHFKCSSSNAYGSTSSADFTFSTTPTLTEIVIDNTDPGWTNISPGSNQWTVGGSSVPMVGSNYLWASGEASTTDTSTTRRCRWTPNLSASGYYDVYAYYQTGSNRTSTANYIVKHFGGQQTSTQNQNGSTGGAYYLLGANLPFEAGTSGYVELSTLGSGSGVVVSADAAKWVYKGPLDLTPPEISIGAPSASITRNGPVTYAVTYDGADNVTLIAANVTLNKTGTANGTVSVSGSGNITRTVTISNITGNGTLGISIAAGTASDNAANFAAAAGPSGTFTVDNTPPTVTIGSPSPTSTASGPVSYTITYGGASTVSLSAANVTLNKTGAANGTVSVSGSGTTTRTVTISSITGDGTLSISLAAGTAADAVGNTAPAAGPSATVSVNNSPLDVSIGSPSMTLTNTGPVTYTVTYSGASSITLASANVTLNKTGTANGAISVSGTGNTTRTVTINNITGDGTLGISIAAGTATGTGGGSAPACGPSATFSVDNTPPVVVIGAPSATPTTAGPVTYLIVYGSANTVTLTSSDITLNKTGTANGTVAVTGSGSTMRTVTVSGITGDGTLSISVPAGTARDNAGNFAAGAGPSAAIVVDNSAPVMNSVSADPYSTSTTSLQGTWSGTDGGTGIVNYEYAVGTTSGGTNVKGWTSAGSATSANITGVSLAYNGTYYITVRAADGMGRTSAAMSSAAIRIARPTVNIQHARSFANGQAVAVTDKIITAIFSDRFYVSEPNRIAGIRVQGTTTAQVGQKVTVMGILGIVGGCERVILSPMVTSPIVGAALQPLFMTTGNAGGIAFNAATPGVTGGVGVHNIGLFVRMAGKVSKAITGGFVLNDGSNITDSLGNAGIKVRSSVVPTVGTPVIVTGVISAESVGGSIYPVVLSTGIIPL